MLRSLRHVLSCSIADCTLVIIGFDDLGELPCYVFGCSKIKTGHLLDDSWVEWKLQWISLR